MTQTHSHDTVAELRCIRCDTVAELRCVRCDTVHVAEPLHMGEVVPWLPHSSSGYSERAFSLVGKSMFWVPGDSATAYAISAVLRNRFT